MTKKFRIWDAETKTFLQELAPYYWHVPRPLGGFDEEIVGEANLHDFSSIISNRGFVIQQWTGLLDKNGREIYEGDIVSFDVYEPHDQAIDHITNAEVWWDREFLCWNFGRFKNTNYSPPFEYSYDMSSAIKRDSFLVTGNIFQLTS